MNAHTDISLMNSFREGGRERERERNALQRENHKVSRDFLQSVENTSSPRTLRKNALITYV
jgi:hypothetical protein